jgi:hypothetical protein
MSHHMEMLAECKELGKFGVLTGSLVQAALHKAHWDDLRHQELTRLRMWRTWQLWRCLCRSLPKKSLVLVETRIENNLLCSLLIRLRLLLTV